jgi:hypothetical protein
MKKQLLIIALLFMSFLQLAAQGNISRIGGQLIFATKADYGLGFGASGEFSLGDKVTLAPMFTYFLGRTQNIGGTDVSSTGYSLDADIHYYFSSNFYGIGGLCYSGVTAKAAGVSASDSKIGVNLGVGAALNPESKTVPFAELKYNTPLESLFITAGVRFSIAK